MALDMLNGVETTIPSNVARSEAPWANDAATVARALDVDPAHGLTSEEVVRRRRLAGPNVLDAAEREPAWRRLLRQFTDPLVLLLLAAIVVSVLAWLFDDGGDAPIEAAVIAAIVVLNAAIGYWQEARAIAAVEALQEMTTTHVTVVRNGAASSVASTDLVPGDVVQLTEGDAIGADCRLLAAVTLEVAEAPLTGESAPVAKTPGALPLDVELQDRSNMVFSGTGVARGAGRGVVVATGMRTEIGRIATLLDRATDERTPLQRQIAWLGKMLGLTVVVLAALVVLAILLTSEVGGPADVVDALLVGVSLAVAAVPEGLPAILTVVLALGVQRMATHHAIVKRLSSVETLGSAAVVCTDKTGTLTRNEMTIVRAVTPSETVDITGVGYEPVGDALVRGHPIEDPELLREVQLLLRAGSLANDAALETAPSGRCDVRGDPTEAAFLVAERKLGITDERLRRFRRVAELPFDAERKLMTTVDHDREAGDAERELILVTKGAPEVLLDRCTHERIAGRVVPLSDARRLAVLAAVDELADDALRTLAVAYRRLDVVDRPLDESFEQGLTHLGVVGIIDPPRPEVADAVAEAHRAGIRVVMITGDHPRTAARIGERLGILDPAQRDTGAVVSGRRLAELGGEGFAEAAREGVVFARVTPEHKLRIVESLQQDGRIVAMTGDGVNDAPALQQAEIGVAMGINGTEVSKEAADMILADDNFATILRAVREGREILGDIRKFLRYLLGSNTGEVLVMLVGVLAAGAIGLTATADGLAVPLLATQILWINLVTDSALALALGVDPAVDDVMAQPPRPLGDRIIDRSMIVRIALVGVVSAAGALAALDLELAGGLLGGNGDLETARTMAFTTLVLGQVFDAYNSRSALVSAFVRPLSNRLLTSAAALTVVLQIAVVHLPPLQGAFDTAPLDARQWLLCTALASAVLLAEELRKVLSIAGRS